MVALISNELLSDSMKDLESNQEKFRNRAFNILLPVSETEPSLLYPQWDRIAAILEKEEVSNKYVAIHLIANLVRVDRDQRFEQLFDDFYDLIRHESPVVSPHIAGKSGKIINAKPYLQQKIISILLSTDRISLCRHKELLKAYVIMALDEAYANITNKDAILQYVENQVKSESLKTRKVAKEFLRKYKT